LTDRSVEFFSPSLLCLTFQREMQGNKIQAYLPTLCMERLGRVFHENRVYVIANFHLIPNVGSTRVTSHRYKIKILTTTMVVPCDNYIIHRYGVSLMSYAKINERRHGCAHLIGKCL
jgi:hypothetical protein